MSHLAEFRTNRPIFSSVHPACYGGVMAGYAAFLVAAWLAYATTGEVAFALVVSTGFALIYFGLAAMLVRMAPSQSVGTLDEGSLRDWLDGYIAIYTGFRENKGALLEMITLPAALAAGFAAMGVAAVVARTGATAI